MGERSANVHLFPMLPFSFLRGQFGKYLMDRAEREDARHIGSPKGIPIIKHLEKEEEEEK